MRAVDFRHHVRGAGLVLVAAVIGFAGAPATAATPAQPPAAKHGITISPSQKDITISSGLLEATTHVTLTNNSGARLIGTIKVLDFKTLNETGGLIFTQAGVSASKYGLAKYMTLPNGDTVNLADGQTLDIPVHIVNQANLTPGGHYGAVVITLGGPDVAGSQTNFKQELVSLLLVRKLGGEHYGLQLDSLQAEPGNSQPDMAALSFKNTGNVHAIPHGYVTVADSKGLVLAKGTINADSLPVLPDSSRRFVTSLQTTATSKHHGNYKVTAYYRYDGQNDFSVRTIYVQSSSKTLPVIITGVALLLIGAFLWRSRRRFSRKRRYSI